MRASRAQGRVPAILDKPFAVKCFRFVCPAEAGAMLLRLPQSAAMGEAGLLAGNELQ
jgi:hypothetical protein